MPFILSTFLDLKSSTPSVIALQKVLRACSNQTHFNEEDIIEKCKIPIPRIGRFHKRKGKPFIFRVNSPWTAVERQKEKKAQIKGNEKTF